MSTPVRYDQQYCPIARSLDVLGDRWTLPILRELSLGDQRFSDLRDHLPGIAPTVLTQRLRSMTADGLVAQRPASPSSRRSVYTLAARGREAIPILSALVRWGVPLLGPPPPDDELRPRSAVTFAVSTWYDPAAAAGVDERYRLLVDSEEITLSSVRGGGKARAEADLELEAGPGTWVELRRGTITLREARDRGLLRVRGPAKSLRNFQRIFQVN